MEATKFSILSVLDISETHLYPDSILPWKLIPEACRHLILKLRFSSSVGTGDVHPAKKIGFTSRDFRYMVQYLASEQ